MLYWPRCHTENELPKRNYNNIQQVGLEASKENPSMHGRKHDVDHFTEKGTHINYY